MLDGKSSWRGRCEAGPFSLRIRPSRWVSVEGDENRERATKRAKAGVRRGRTGDSPGERESSGSALERIRQSRSADRTMEKVGERHRSEAKGMSRKPDNVYLVDCSIAECSNSCRREIFAFEIWGTERGKGKRS